MRNDGDFKVAEMLASRQYNIRDLFDAGFTSSEMKQASVCAADARVGGYTLFDLKYGSGGWFSSCYTTEELVTAGFSREEIANCKTPTATAAADTALTQLLLTSSNKKF
jgi:hypothetical protein